MADNVTLNAGSGGDTVAADDVGGVKYQVVKLAVGADGAASLVANANPIPVSDAGGALTVDGTVAVSGTVTVDGSGVTQPVSNAGLTELAAAINGSSQLDVNIAASAATLTVASHAVTNAGTFATQVDGAALTALQLIDNIVATEDAVAGTGYSGVPFLAVRQDSHSNLAADGDFISPTIDADGGLRVSIVAGAGSGGTAVADDADFTDGTTSLTPVGGVYESTPSTVTDGDIGMAGITVDRSLKVHITGITGSQTDDAAFTPGTSIVSIVGAEFDDTTPDSVDEGDGGALRMSGNRNLYTTIRDAAGNERGANVNASNQLSVIDANSASALTALQLIDNVVATEDAVAGTGYSGVPMLVVRQDSQSGLAADGNFISPTIDSAGGLRVSIVAGAGSGGTSATDDAAFTAGSGAGTPMMGFATADSVDSGDVGVVAMTTARALHTAVQSIAAGDNNIGNVDIVTMPNVTLAAGTNTNEVVGDVAQDAAVAGNPVLSGLRASTAIPTAMSGDGDAVYAWGDLNGATIVAGRIVDDAAFTPGTSRVSPIGLMADESSTDSVDEGDAGIPRMTLDRKTIVTPYVHAAAGGQTPHQNLDCDETEDDIKTSPGKLFWVHAVNLANAKRYLKFYNATAANTTVGSTTPVLTFPIPTMGDTNGAGFTIHFGDAGVQFDTAICVAATTGFAVADTGAPGANEIILNCGYS